MRKASCAVLGFVALLGVCADLAAAQQPGERPDFTGVWTTYTEPGQGRGGRGGGRAAGPGLPFTDEAKKKIAAYRALVSPTSETPGGYCREATAEREKAEGK
jgi:hypothetical protein